MLFSQNIFIYLIEVYMKNKFLCFAVIAVTALVFIGCSSDEEKMGEKTKTDMMGDKMADDKIPGDMMMVGSVLEHGTITAGDGMGTQIRINSKKDGMSGASDDAEVLINIEEKTPTIDVTAGASTKKTNIKEGAEIYAWVSPAYTASLPPQTAAKTIFVNVTDKSDIPAYVEIEAVESADNGLTVTDTDGMKWMVAGDAVFTMHASKDAVDAASLKKGVKALFWADKMSDAMDTKKTAKILIIEK